MKMHLWVMLIFTIVACEIKEEVIDYYPNGKVKIKGQLVDGVRHGIFLEYYSSGKLKFKEPWIRGKVNGPFEEYSPKGKIHKKGIVKDNKLVEEIYFFETGEVHKIQKYDKDGYIETVEKYRENGERDSIAYPYLEIHDVKVGDTATFRIRIVNLSNPLDSLFRSGELFDSGELIITSGFDTTRTDKVLKDTLATIHSKDGLTFQYKFNPHRLGENYVYGQLILEKNRGKTTDVQLHKFVTRYSVYN
jgi:hypothetical protein